MCEKCRDSGFIIWRDERGYEYAKRCECMEQEMAEKRIADSGISEAFQKKTLDAFEDTSTILARAKGMAKNYADSFLEKEGSMNNSIMFLGNPGSGKTHLSLAIANILLNEKNVACLYVPYRETMTELKQLRDNNEEFEMRMRTLTNARVLVIDDLFKGTVTEADLNYLFMIINKRYLNQKPFICSSEKSINDLLEYDEAIGSRMIEQAKGNIVMFNDKKLNYRMNNL